MKTGSLKLKLVGTSIAAASLAFVGGCHNDDHDFLGASEKDIIATQVNGSVIDDYLANALICSDANRNGNCDTGEDSTMSDAQGDFELFTATPTAPLLAIGIPGETSIVGESSPITEPIVLLAPAGSSTITPLTTLVQVRIEQSGESADDAQQAVRTALSIPNDINLLSYDYAAALDANADDEVAAEVSVVAQQIVTTIRANFAVFAEANGEEAGTSLNAASIDRDVFDASVQALFEEDAGTTGLAAIQSSSATLISVAKANGGTVRDVVISNTGEPSISVNGTPVTAGIPAAVTAISATIAAGILEAVKTKNAESTGTNTGTGTGTGTDTGTTGGTGGTGGSGSGGSGGGGD